MNDWIFFIINDFYLIRNESRPTIFRHGFFSFLFQDLFSELGDLIRSNVHFDVSGRSLGTAEIVYARPGDAVAALKKYNGVPLDGKELLSLVISHFFGLGRSNKL